MRRVGLFAVAVALGCGGLGAPERAPVLQSAEDPPETAEAPHGLVVDGEPFATRQVHDPGQQGMLVGLVSAPASWTVDVKVAWNYANVSAPLSVTSVMANPASPEALFGWGAWQAFDLQPRGFYERGRTYGGLVYEPPAPPAEALLGFVRDQRGRMPDFHVVGVKDLPDLAAALQLPPSPDQHGIGAKVTYTLDGRPIEEEFYAVHYVARIPYDGPQGRTWQINWGLLNLHSFRAPAGTLDRRRPVFAAAAKSFRANPAWEARVKAVNAWLAAEYARELQAGYDQIAAAGRLSRQISANNDAMLRSIDQQLAASSASADPAARSEADKFDDYVRGVDTLDDPYYGTTQRDANYQYHWTDGYGNYRDSNDPTADPNQAEPGEWRPMNPR